MTEVALEFPRSWLEFVDPAEPTRLFRCDTTWLTSRWMCIFGQGCRGIYADSPTSGCCTLGAHFADDDDRDRTIRWAAHLDGALWAHRSAGLREGIVALDADGDEQTRVVDGACLFLNPPGFAGGAGCALHHLALARGLDPQQTKPDVCWQLPVRRDFEQRSWPDGTDLEVVVITEYDRRGWGPGGHDLDWYCSGATEAHVATEPVYVTERVTLVALMGEPGYDELARLLAQVGPGLPHPADPGGQAMAAPSSGVGPTP